MRISPADGGGEYADVLVGADGLHSRVRTGLFGPDDPRYVGYADTVLSLCTVLVMIAAVASVVVRFRRAKGEERQQIKWFAYSAVLLASAVGLGVLTGRLAPVRSEQG